MIVLVKALLAHAQVLTEIGVKQEKPAKVLNEARSIYRPINATEDDFRRISEKFDILHFSMHAEIEKEFPLTSFLGFKAKGINDGRLTVEEILDIKLKKGSLVFLASCDTNNVLNGEGLVSLAWGMMASGVTTVISAQSEAPMTNQLQIFTKTFYEHYKRGTSTAEAMQKASLKLIKNKSGNLHEP